MPDLIVVQILVQKFSSVFPDIDRGFLSLAIMRVLREGTMPADMVEFERQVREVLKHFGSLDGR